MNIEKMKTKKNFKFSISEEEIPSHLLEKEKELNKVKWFDYRKLNNVASTSLFFLLYLKVYREFFAKEFDVDDAVNQIPDFCDESGEVNMTTRLFFWVARQTADSLGCKYEFFIRTAFKRVYEFGWSYLPTPEQMTSMDAVEDIKDAWNDWKKVSLQLASNPCFLAKAYCGLPEQNAYHDYLVEQVNSRVQRTYMIARVVYQEKLIPIGKAEELFGKEELDSALKVYLS